MKLPELQTDNITLTNGQRLPSPAVADHTIAMMYALVRGLDGFHDNQARGEWNPDTYERIASLAKYQAVQC